MSKILGKVEFKISTLVLKWMFNCDDIFLKIFPLFREILVFSALVLMLRAMFVRAILVNFLPPVSQSAWLAVIWPDWLSPGWQKEIVISLIFLQSSPGHPPLWSPSLHWLSSLSSQLSQAENQEFFWSHWMTDLLPLSCMNNGPRYVININLVSIGWCSGITGGGGGGGVSLHYYA